MQIALSQIFMEQLLLAYIKEQLLVFQLLK
jgi:hypothetical protein